MTDWGNVLSQSLPNLSGTPGRGAATPRTAAATTTPAHQPVARNIQWQTPGGSAATGIPAATTSSQTVEEMIAKHEQGIMDKLLHETDEETKTQTADFLEARMQQMWQEDREVWIQELIGVRSLGGLSATTSNQQPLLGNGKTTLHLLQAPGATALGASHLALPSSSATTVAGSAWSQAHAFALGQGRRPTEVNQAWVQAHREVLRTTSNPYHIAGAIKQLIDPSTRDPVLSGYATGWDWTMTLLEARSTESPIDRAAATLVHLCRQFHRLVKQRVQTANASGATTGLYASSFTSEAAQQCLQYSGLELGDVQGTQSVWSVLYYCLRIGNATAALEVWSHAGHSSNLTDSQNKAIRQILTVLAEGGVDCLWERGIPTVPSNERLELFDVLERQSDEMMSDTTDMHKTGVLALLSGLADLPNSNTPGFADIEDYMFGCLWKALMDKDPLDKLREVGEQIQGLGAAHFHDDEENGGWSYALPLLISQQYARAFVHLAQSGNDVRLQAAHLTLVLATAGVEISNLGEGNLNQHLVASIVEAYANQLLAEPWAGSLAALDYLIRIPDKERACKEVAKLIAKTGEVKTLVGSFDENGLPLGEGTLDKHLSRVQISAVLAEAAALSTRNRSDQPKVGTALMCYMLAGRFDSVLVLLNEMISPPDRQDENREHWIVQTKEFLDNFIVKRTSVFDVLERERKTSLIQASRTLMDLNRFFVLLYTARYAEAWAVVKELRLVPLVQSDLGMMETKFRTMDDVIRRSYPAVLLGAMQTLYREHMRIKSDVQGGTRDVVLERLRELQQHARFVVTFAGLIGTAADKMESLSQMQALMI